MKITVHDLETDLSLKLGRDLSEIYPDEKVTIQIDSNWARPFGMAYTACVLKQFRSRCREFDFSMSPVMNKGLTYASNMGFFKFISAELPLGKEPGEAHGNNHCIPLTVINFKELHAKDLEYYLNDEVEENIEKEARKLATVLVDDDKNIKKILTYLIREILRNIPEHSGCTKALVCGQAWDRNHQAEIAILDEGEGIYESLSRNRFYKDDINDNVDALDLALAPGVSVAYRPKKKRTSSESQWSNSGYGLYVVKEICKELNGSFLIASGTDYLKVSVSGVTIGKTYFSGTAIKMTIDTNAVHEKKDLITSIVNKGQQEAKQSNDGFHTASKPSRGL